MPKHTPATNLDGDKDAYTKYVKSVSQKFLDQSDGLLEAMSEEYWKQHKLIAETAFQTRWHQFEAIARLSQLGLALHAQGEARQVVNVARCNL